MLSYLKEKLNQEQYQAAIHNTSSSLILAGAGSGKTRTVTYKIAYLVSLGIDPRRIFGVTFTNKAANEMKERLTEIIKEVGQLGLLQNAKPINFGSFKRIGTFHGLFLKILKEDIEELNLGYTKDFSIYDSGETMSIVKKLIKKYNLKGAIEPKEARGMISKMKNEGITYERFSISAGQSPFDTALATIYKDYQKQLRTSNCLDFDDLLLLPYMLFSKNEKVLKKRQDNFEYIMVDEAQDTNRIQFELMQKLGGTNAKLTFIGDDYQSIYGRRGAIMDNFLNLKKYRPDMEMFKLQINYRSKPHIVEAGNHIIKKNTKQYDKTVTAYREGSEKIIVFNHPSDLQEAINIIDFIVQTREKKQKNRSDFAILYRTNAQSSIFERVFVQQAIPYRVFGAFKFFERAEVKDIVSYVKFLNNPKDDIALMRIINVPKRGVGKTTIDKIQKYATDRGLSMYEVLLGLQQYDVGINAGKQTDLYKFGQLIFSRSEYMQNHYPAELIAKIISDINYRDYLVKEEGKEKGDEKFENIGQLINMAEKYGNSEQGIGNSEQRTDVVETDNNLSNNTSNNISQQKTSKKDFLNESRDSGLSNPINSDILSNSSNLSDSLSASSDLSVDVDDLFGDDQSDTVIPAEEEIQSNNDHIAKTKKFLEEITLMTDVAQADANTVDAIKLMTVHSSKGLEFPYVFVVGLEENIFPLGNASLDPKDLEEERRLMYVAITRAKDHLFLSSANSRMQRGQVKNNAPSRFINELPEELLKKYDLGGSNAMQASFIPQGPELDIEDRVKHKLFGEGEVMEVWKGVCIVRLDNPKFGVRKIENRYLELIG